jgi:uncharacterized protein (TIRG00374 family)
MLKKARGLFFLLLKIAVSAAILFFIFRRIDEKSLLAIISGADKPLLALAFAVFFLNYILCFVRWEVLLRAFGIKLAFRRIFTAYAGGVFFNLFLPSTIGGDFLRTLDLATHTRKPKEILATVLLDRLSGYIGLVLLALCALIAGRGLINEAQVAMPVALITAILLGILAVLFNPFCYELITRLSKRFRGGRIIGMLVDLHEEIHIFRRHKKVIVYNMLISLLVQAVPCLSFYILARAIGIEVHMLYFFIFLPIIGAITLLPISIGGLGLRDATTIYFFAQAGVAKDFSFAMSLINFSFILVCGCAAGLLYVFTLHHRRLQPDPSSDFRGPLAR